MLAVTVALMARSGPLLHLRGFVPQWLCCTLRALGSPRQRVAGQMRDAIGHRSRALAARHGAAVFAGLVGLAWFFHLGYGATLPPTEFRWMLRQDWAANFFGFAFFRNAPWGLPLGATPDLIWPYGTSLGFTDALPWIAVVLKPISPLLHPGFQPFGAWYLACFVLQGWFGAKLTGTFTADRALQALGGALFALTPVIPARNGHIALCALFFVTAALCLALRPAASRTHALRTVGGALLLLVWAAGTHPYLAIMALALILAGLARLTFGERALSPLLGLGAAAVAAGVTLATFWLFGYVGWGEHLVATGFGQFSADLNTLYNPQRWSRWIGELRHQPRQHEGFAYLGCSVLALLALRAALYAREPAELGRGLRRTWPVLLAIAAMAFFALSSSVKYRGAQVLDLSSLYAPLSKLTAVFRSSGRFVWPLHVGLIALAVSGVAALNRPWLARALLLAAVLVQGAELERGNFTFFPAPMERLKHPVWASVSEDYRHMELVPSQLKWISRYDELLVNRVSYEAYRRRLTFNSGNAARRDRRATLATRKPVPARVEPGTRTIYVVEPRFRFRFGSDATCGKLDGLVICVATRHETALLEALRQNP